MTTRPDLSRSHPPGIRRDGATFVSFTPGKPATRWSKHAKLDHGQTHLPARYLSLRDAMPGSAHVMEALRKHVPRAAQIIDSFVAGELNTRDAAIKADEDYQGLLKTWRSSFLGSSAARSTLRTDADAVWLHAETVHVLARILEQRHAEATIFNVIPTEVIGTGLTTYMQYQKIVTDEEAVLGDSFEPMGAGGGGSSERGSILRQIRFYKMSAGWTERELEVEADIRANNPGLAWSLVADKMDGAQRAMDRMRANIAAFGELKPQGLDGLLYGSTPATNATESEFAGVDPEVNVNNLLNLVAGQSTDVNFQKDRIADSLAIDPASYAHLARQMWTDGVTTPGESALENFMRRAPTIKKVVVVDEFRSTGAAAIAKIETKGVDSTTAARRSGGIRIGGEQRSVAMAYCDNADVFAHVVGRQLEVRTWPEHRGHFSTVMRESSGGVVCFEPLGLKMIYRPEDGDPALS